jgi:hypothetical protein
MGQRVVSWHHATHNNDEDDFMSQPRFRPLRTSRRPGGYAVTPAPGGRDFHPHEKLSYKVDALRLARELRLSFSQRIARVSFQHPTAVV